ncbi:3-deoxy-D-manno-octulosonic acid transferase [Leisingera aquaemixtae]|uniref:3-deoxy-D-manno-octulosonic acid transferase n=1 Tax=Leisingera aquaemixtae TaxID=1396826 RepID=UPI0021A4F924|nr:glycosyltransferase N-terminal domain-containing protein [Leisingera aquaemixtae]UWQ45481.1 3-deoxy-D-manno-octulosonic acid transferase [Leisingera aquaemixtae]
MQRRTTAPSRRSVLQPRPRGELLWVHATTAERYLALCDIGRRLKTLRPDLSVLASWEPGLRLTGTVGCDVPVGPLAEDTQAEAREFLGHWQPDACIWTGPPARRVMLRQLREQGTGVLLADLLEDEVPNRASRWLPDQRRRLLEGLTCILTPSKDVQARLVRTGFPAERVELAGKLRVSAIPPGCNDDELAGMQQTLGSRPVWLAAHVKLSELSRILDAHRGALRLLHRLLLVVALDDYADLDAARSLLQDSGLSFADWETGGEPDDFTQVLLTGGEDLGLWYRLSPVALIASSLDPAAQGQSPLDAAALGSALLHGPGIHAHRDLYERLTKAGAARPVRTQEEMTDAVVAMSAPDKAAEMALAGWQSVTESAATTDTLLEKVQDLLDRREDTDAGT